MPTAKQTCRLIHGTVAVLFECRILAGELVFTAAAFYELYHFRLGASRTQSVMRNG